jgi:hypothetical protein
MYSMRHLLTLLCMLPLILVAQTPSTEGGWLRRTTERMFGDSVPPGKPRFLIYPTLGYAPETSFEIGFSAVTLFYARGDYQRNRLSEIQLFSFFTLERQYGAWFDHAVYGHEDRWFFLGKIRLQRFPLLYYGIGPEAPGDEPNLVQADYTLVRERVLHKLVPNLFLGIEVDYQRLYNATFERPVLPAPTGSAGSRNLGLGLGLVYDNRHNVLNVREGLFAELAYLAYQPTWGSDFKFQGWYADARYYHPMPWSRQQVLAAQVLGTFMQGEVPFNQLALMGGDQMMRGYYTGRLRDRNYIAAQVAYRFLPFPFSKRLGASAFLSAGAVAPEMGAFRARDIRPAGGVGLRYLLFPAKDIFVRLDLGITQEGTGIYFYTGEAF